MEGSLGSLVVQITTDLTNLNAGLRNADKGVRDTSDKINSYLNKASLAMTAMGAAITGALALVVKSATDYSEQIYEVSERTGVAVETLSKLRYVAEQTESSFEAVSMAMRFLNRHMHEAATGSFEASKSFNDLGVSLKDEVTGAALTTEQAFLRIADRFSQITSSSEKTSLAMKIFGRGGEAIIPILNLGSEGIERLSKRAHELGIVLTAENAKSIDTFDDSIKTLQASFMGLWLNISQMLLPALTSLSETITKVVISLRNWSEKSPEISKFVLTLVAGFGALLAILGPLLWAFNQFLQVFINLKIILPVLAAALAPFTAGLSTVLYYATAIATAFAGWKIAQWLGFGKKTETPNVDLGRVVVSKKASEMEPEAMTVDLHLQKVRELNEAYLNGKIGLEEYAEQSKALHEDGIEFRTMEKDLVEQSIELEQTLTDGVQQRMNVYQQGMQTAQEFANVQAEIQNQDLMRQQQQVASATSLLRTLQEGMNMSIWSTIFDFINMGLKKFETGLTQALTGIIMGTKKASEAFKEFGNIMLTAIVEFIIQAGIQALIAMTIGSLITGMVSGMASALASAWLMPALLASIATMGAADAAGVAGLAMAMTSGVGLLAGMKATTAIAGGGAGGGFAEGGPVGLKGPEMILVGEKGPEYVVPNDQLNNMGTNITVNVSANVSSNIDASYLGEEIGNQIERRLRKGR